MPCGPINTIDMTFAEPQVKHLGIARDVKHPKLGNIKVVGNPINMTGAPQPKRLKPTPELGQHNNAVLKGLESRQRRSRNCAARARSDGPPMKKGKTAHITGAGKNISRACALGLAEDGFNVAINGSSDRAACDSVAREAAKFGVKALVIMGDVGKPEECKRIAGEAIKAFGAVDALLNNAALRPNKPFLEMTEAEWDRVIWVDLNAAAWLARACLPGMVQKGWGRIVNFAGMNAIHGHAGRAPVSVAKHGVWGLSKALAMEFETKGVTDQHHLAGPIRPTSRRRTPRPRPAPRRRRVPLGRLRKPVEVAAAARLLVSEAGAYINGQIIQVNGGGAT